MNGKSSETAGFSAMELVVVIGVIALILILAWPALQTRRTAVLNRELQTAMLDADRDKIVELLKLGAWPHEWNRAIPQFCIYCYAIEGGDREMFRLAVSFDHMDSDAFRYHCPSLLVVALDHHDTQTIEFLLRMGISPIQRYQCVQDWVLPRPNYMRLSPLAAAIEMNDVSMTNLFLSHTSPTDLQKPDHPSGPLGKDSTLFHSAVRSGNTEWIALLAKRGVPINSIDRLGDTALHEAARLGDRAMIEALLAHGADPGIRDTSGARPLDKVPARYRAELAELLGDSAVE